MTAFEEALVAVMIGRVAKALESMAKLATEKDPGARTRLLGDAHMALVVTKENLGCLQELNELHKDLERKSA